MSPPLRKLSFTESVGVGTLAEAGVEDLLVAVLLRIDSASASVLLRAGVLGVVSEVVEAAGDELLRHSRPRSEPHISHLFIEGWLKNVQTSQARPFLLFESANWDVESVVSVGGALAGLVKGSGLVASGSSDFGGRGDRVAIGRAGSLVTPHSSHEPLLAALLKPQIAQTQLDPAASEAEESAAEALILQSLLDVALSRGESVCGEEAFGRVCGFSLEPSPLVSGLARVRVILGLLLRNPA